MDVRKALRDIVWIKPWSSPREVGRSPAALRLVRECGARPAPEPLALGLDDIIANSNEFPLAFPIHTVRLENLKSRRPAKRLKSNIESTYPIMHERVVTLIANFILYKRTYGSSIEKDLYKNMSIIDFIDRLMKKRAATFMKAQDQYKLLTGETGRDGWEAVGTDEEKAPLLLKDCLSYDEMKISALVCVSGRTECLNDGTRKNAGLVKEDNIEENAVIIGIVGARFKRKQRMEYEDILVTPEQNVPENGYGRDAQAADPAKLAYRQMWDTFYQIPSTTHADLMKEVSPVPCTGKRVFSLRWAGASQGAFDNAAFQRRLALVADVVLLEADARAKESGQSAFVNVIGAGLGIWKHSVHQIDIFVLTFLERVASLLDAGRLDHVTDVNFAYIEPKKDVLALFKTIEGSNDDENSVRITFLKNESHPQGGISVQLESRQPSARLGGRHAGKLLVLTYPWDSNAHPGNEFWMGKLSSSGDSAAACSSQISELHNAHVNPAVGGARAGGRRRGAQRAGRVLRDH